MTPPSFSHCSKSVSIEAAAIIALALAAGIIETTYSGYFLLEKEDVRILPSIVNFSFVLFFYFIIRLFFRLPLALTTVLALHFALIEINTTKQALTTEPLSWTDISSSTNISVIWHYASIWHLLFIPFLIWLAYIAFKFKQVYLPSKRNCLVSATTLFLLLPLAFYPYLDKFDENLGHKVQSKLSDLGVQYHPWDWSYNLKSSGLIMHLIQTSRREIPDKPSDTEVKLFETLDNGGDAVSNNPKNIIFILCEACWFNDDLFANEFTHLENRSFQKFRAASPVYGGATVNSSFELLTGLPSRGALTGIIYQEYADLLRDEATTFPRALKKIGYKTIAAHNHYRKFYRRDLVKPKLGFDVFFGLEDMNYSGPIWADDGILFEKAASELKLQKGPVFLFLTTAYTHGGYKPDGDYGQKDYSKRLNKTISRIADFVDKALKIEPNTAILIIGDHKPALTKFFYEKSVLPKSIFEKIGDRNEEFKFKPKPPLSIVGDVPAFFYSPDKSRAKKFAEVSNSTPFYCVPNLFDKIFVGVDLPAFDFARKNGICNKQEEDDYYKKSKSFPDYIFSLSLLK